MIYYLGIIDKLNELNDKLNNMIGDKVSNLYVGVAILAVLIFLAVFTINELNKK